MKKKLILLVGIMTAFASCSTEDIVDTRTASDDEISFNASVRFSSVTRGIESDNNALNSFYVSAFPVGQESYPIFENILFYKENGKYVTEKPYHWSHELKLDIFAYGYCMKEKQRLPENAQESALVSGGAELEVTDMQRTLNNFTPNPKIEDQIDFIFTKQLNVSQPGMTSSVSLVFDHMLSEIGVDATCSSKTHRVKIAKIKYGNIFGTANFNMEYQTPGISGDRPAWSELRDKTTYEIELPKPVTLTDKATNISLAEEVTKPIGFAILLPQDHSTFNSSTEFFGVGKDGKGPAGKSLASAQYLAVLCRIELIDEQGNPKGSVKFPVNDDFYVDVPVDEYNTEVYGWAYIPFHLAKDNDSDADKAKYSKWQMGNRYRYHLDFTDGAGYNDNGDPIIMGPITFTASVNTWNNVDINRPRQD